MHALHATLLMLLRDMLSLKILGMVQQEVTRLDAIPEDLMRQLRFATWLTELPDDVVLDTLEHLLEGARHDKPRFRAVINSLLDGSMVQQQLGAERLESLRQRSTEARRVAVHAFLSADPPHKRYYAAHVKDVNEQLESRPLGWRKTLARGNSRLVFDRLVFDKHPMVIEILLNNPHILERDVIKMAALQPTSEHALKTIFAHPRWIRRYSIKKSLVFNPYTPISIVESLLAYMLEQDLRDASRSRRLSPTVRARAGALLEDRQRLRHPQLLTSGDDADSAGGNVVALKSTKPEGSSLAEDFLTSLGDLDADLKLLTDADLLDLEITSLRTTPIIPDLEEDEVLDEAEDFLSSLPSQLGLVPVGEDDE